jgi:hypothetical protein
VSLHTVYGLNGVGKDTIAHELRNRNPNLVTTSESRMLMYLLGITTGFDATLKVDRSQYSQLECTPQEQIIELEQGSPMRELVGNVSADNGTVLNLSHLVFARYLDDEIDYLQKPKATWYVHAGDSFMNVVAPPETILKRRQADAAQRERILKGVDEISYHQSLCDREWERIKCIAQPLTRFAVIENVELIKAVEQAEEVIYGQ